MKVRKEVIEASVAKLIDQIIGTMPNSTYKFILGGASVLATLSSSKALQNALGSIQDENGLVDVDLIEKMLEGAFKASDNSLQLEFFNTPGLLSMFVKPITVTIKKEDIDLILNEIKKYSVSNEVSLSPMAKTIQESNSVLKYQEKKETM